MTKKAVLRKALDVASFALLFHNTIKFFLGKVDTIDIIYIRIAYTLLALWIILKIICKCINVFSAYKLYKAYEDELNYLKCVHKTRYKLYFTGTREDVKKYSEEIERCGTNILENGKDALSKNLFLKIHSKRVEEMLEQTKKLMTTEKA